MFSWRLTRWMSVDGGSDRGRRRLWMFQSRVLGRTGGAVKRLKQAVSDLTASLGRLKLFRESTGTLRCSHGRHRGKRYQLCCPFVALILLALDGRQVCQDS